MKNRCKKCGKKIPDHKTWCNNDCRRRVLGIGEIFGCWEIMDNNPKRKKILLEEISSRLNRKKYRTILGYRCRCKSCDRISIIRWSTLLVSRIKEYNNCGRCKETKKGDWAFVDDSRKRCIRCGDIKNTDEFKTRASVTCNRCRKNTELQRLFGVSVDEYEGLLERQHGRCLICGTHYTDLNKMLGVDHCHTTGQVRGLLCNSCNMGLGLFHDDPSSLQRAIGYLTRQESKTKDSVKEEM